MTYSLENIISYVTGWKTVSNPVSQPVFEL